MITSLNLTTESINLLKLRGQTDQQVSDFGALLDKAREQQQSTTAKEVLVSMNKEELKLVQTAAGLADPIQVSALSKEGAMNLLAQPDKTNMVDLNNDGIVEIGIAKMMTFPPVNAPAEVHQAWEEATAGMSEGDKMIMQLTMHHQVYGVNIEGITNNPVLSPEDQWSSDGWQQLIARGRAALEFAVSIDGWTRYNQVTREFYDNFELALSSTNETAANASQSNDANKEQPD